MGALAKEWQSANLMFDDILRGMSRRLPLSARIVAD